LNCDDFGSADLLRPGNVIGFTVETVGLQGKSLSIRWSMFDATTSLVVDDSTLVDQAGWPEGLYEPAAYRDRNYGELWVPLPPVEGEFFIRVELLQPDGGRLDSQDTELFRAG